MEVSQILTQWDYMPCATIITKQQDNQPLPQNDANNTNQNKKGLYNYPQALREEFGGAPEMWRRDTSTDPGGTVDPFKEKLPGWTPLATVHCACIRPALETLIL